MCCAQPVARGYSVVVGDPDGAAAGEVFMVETEGITAQPSHGPGGPSGEHVGSLDDLAAELPTPVLLLSVTLPAAPGYVRHARRMTECALRMWPRFEIDTVVLLVSEVVSNAVRHAGSSFVRLSIEFTGELRVTVTDSGRGEGRPQAGEAGPEAEGGRGLAIVERAAARSGIRVEPCGSVSVWFAVRPQEDAETGSDYGDLTASSLASLAMLDECVSLTAELCGESR